MPRILKPADASTYRAAENALLSLRAARDHLRDAGCPRSLARVLAAIRSTEGAIRHVERRACRSVAALDGSAT